MASNKNSSSNRTEVPEARDAMDRFKMEGRVDVCARRGKSDSYSYGIRGNY